MAIFAVYKKDVVKNDAACFAKQSRCRILVYARSSASWKIRKEENRPNS